ncbi:MAG: hypothetical protein PHI79_01360 [Sulfurovaceae bacterium]|nr:hypothetical protein [Sulfurovaceae bacterium]MDD5548223.1 hypothetical protein [Sulfurovaceae bacterium]
MRILFSSIIIIFLSSIYVFAESTVVATFEPETQTITKVNKTKNYDGSHFENAIVIEAKNEMEGVRAEYVWLAKHYPGYKTNKQSLLQNNGKYYDLLNITTADGKQKDFYFDINSFFGKF